MRYNNYILVFIQEKNMMNDDKEKYSNGQSMDVTQMSKEEKIKAIEYWCEGNQQLKKFLLYCNDKGIDTLGCCAGHDGDIELGTEASSAYIAILLGNKTKNFILDLLSGLEEKNIGMIVGLIRNKDDKYFSVLNAKENRKK